MRRVAACLLTTIVSAFADIGSNDEYACIERLHRTFITSLVGVEFRPCVTTTTWYDDENVLHCLLTSINVTASTMATSLGDVEY